MTLTIIWLIVSFWVFFGAPRMMQSFIDGWGDFGLPHPPPFYFMKAFFGYDLRSYRIFVKQVYGLPW